ncbi:MAG TPA: phosphate signaling complex protein PhoU [Candidatus Hydrogenedentes bacterium]|nr:phosphate signaling complex protein PhoU [Candidatus Hydrogenedentota bacterium]
MTKHFERETAKLKGHLLRLCARVEDNVYRAARALETRDARLADEVIQSDAAVDEAEVDVEEECLKILALYQPVAIDLRFMVAVLKINNDLERIGDLAVNIAERAMFLASRKDVQCPFDFTAMARKSQDMLRKSIESMVNMDCSLARAVCAADDAVDAMNREMYGKVQDGIRRNIDHVSALIHLLCASRHLERIADLATNIAQDVIYMVEGEIVRHKTEDYGTARGRTE